MEFIINGKTVVVVGDVQTINVQDVVYSDYRGWMSPDGELHSLSGIDGHTMLAKQFLKRIPKDPIKALQDAGWIRIVCQNSFSCARLDNNTRRLLLGIVIRQRDSHNFFFEVGGKSLQMSRDEAIEYFSD